ncbi:putative c6 zinc finger domain protein [Ilyonectria robusta]
MLKPTVRRSACDQCRAKRVRCLRGQDSTAPCARCFYMSARCVTGASGHPGRPRKQRLASSDGDGTPKAMVTSPVDNLSPASHAMSTLGDSLHSIVAGPAHEQPQPDFFFDSPLIHQGPTPGQEQDMPSLEHQRSSSLSQSQSQGLLNADDENELNAMLHMGGDSSNALDWMLIPSFDREGEVTLPLTPPPSQCFSAVSSLAGFRDEIDQRIASIDAYYSEPSKVVQRCRDDEDEGAGRDVENPAASLLACSRKFIDIIQSLTHPHTLTEDALSTEVVLLALSSYLALMRLLDALFHRIYKYLCQVPRESWQSIKVKSVLRIGGVSSLQDMPLKAYAMGILDAIQGQVRTVERCMGIPAEYCLSGEAVSLSTAAPGILSRADRARLFWVVVAQEDVKSRRGSKSYVESIRASIKESLAFLDG